MREVVLLVLLLAICPNTCNSRLPDKNAVYSRVRQNAVGIRRERGALAVGPQGTRRGAWLRHWARDLLTWALEMQMASGKLSDVLTG